MAAHTVLECGAIQTKRLCVFPKAPLVEPRRRLKEAIVHCPKLAVVTSAQRCFGGGLGIYVGTWQMFDGDQFAANPGDATKEQQITVAERIYSRFGLSGWGCAHELGWLN